MASKEPQRKKSTNGHTRDTKPSKMFPMDQDDTKLTVVDDEGQPQMPHMKATKE